MPHPSESLKARVSGKNTLLIAALKGYPQINGLAPTRIADLINQREGPIINTLRFVQKFI
jgi:hypothetical protein